MPLKNLLTPVGVAKVSSVVLSVVLLGLGINSHFRSDWVKPWRREFQKDERKLHQWCSFFPEMGIKQDPTCPKIALEHLFVSIIVIALCLSAVSLIVTLVGKDKSSYTSVKWVDLGYHILFAILLLIAASLYILSAEQIHKLFETDSASIHDPLDLKRGEKIASAVLALLQAGLYCAIAVLILRSKD